MVKVVNIKVHEFNLREEAKNVKNKSMKMCMDLVGNDLINLLPKKSKITVSFELKETNVDIANAIRRCLTNEIPIYSLTFDETNLDVTDAYILSDFIKKNIELLPIQQDIEYDKMDLEISLEAENNTDKIINVTTSNIHAIGKGGKEIQIVNSNIVLCSLRPMESLRISNIKIKKGRGREDGGMYSAFSNVTYRLMDVVPLDEDTGKGKSSMVSNPTHFYISFTTHRNIDDPKSMMKKCSDVLINRLQVILNDVEKINNKDEYYYSDLLQLETEGSIKKLMIKNEQWTIINMIVRYCFILTNGNIKFVSPSIIHPEKEVGVINIIHPEFSKLIQNVIKKCISDLNEFY